jgi:hypothetical protein
MLANLLKISHSRRFAILLLLITVVSNSNAFWVQIWNYLYFPLLSLSPSLVPFCNFFSLFLHSYSSFFPLFLLARVSSYFLPSLYLYSLFSSHSTFLFIILLLSYFEPNFPSYCFIRSLTHPLTVFPDLFLLIISAFHTQYEYFRTMSLP